MHTCAIMQPTYLPWSGYFSLIKSVDVFIFLDDVQFNRSSWQSSNQILSENKVTKIKVPTIKMPLKTNISEITLDNSSGWQADHFNLIKNSYIGKPGFNYLMPILEDVLLNTRFDKLINLNIKLISIFSELLEKKITFKLASSLNVSGKRSEHVANLCKSVGSKHYISPIGAAKYLKEDNFENKYDIKLLFHKFNHIEYNQNSSEKFYSHLSIIDSIANLGQTNVHNYLNNYEIATSDEL